MGDGMSNFDDKSQQVVPTRMSLVLDNEIIASGEIVSQGALGKGILLPNESSVLHTLQAVQKFCVDQLIEVREGIFQDMAEKLLKNFKYDWILNQEVATRIRIGSGSAEGNVAVVEQSGRINEALTKRLNSLIRMHNLGAR
jgi:hypothetical protein